MEQEWSKQDNATPACPLATGTFMTNSRSLDFSGHHRTSSIIDESCSARKHASGNSLQNCRDGYTIQEDREWMISLDRAPRLFRSSAGDVVYQSRTGQEIIYQPRPDMLLFFVNITGAVRLADRVTCLFNCRLYSGSVLFACLDGFFGLCDCELPTGSKQWMSSSFRGE